MAHLANPLIPNWTPPLDTGIPSALDLNDLSDAIRITLAAANTPIPITWGRDRLFGQLFVVHVDETNGFLYVGYAFGKGPINEFEKILIDGVPLSDPDTMAMQGVANRGFESGDKTGWDNTPRNDGIVSSAEARTGTFSMRVNSLAGGPNQFSDFLIAPPVGTTINAQCFAKRDPAALPNADGLFNIRFFDSSKVQILQVLIGTASLSTSGFQLLSGTAVVPTDAVFYVADLGESSGTTGGWYFDDVETTVTDFIEVVAHKGTSAQAPSELLSAAIAGYTDALPNLAYIVLKVPADATTGFPRVEAIIQGQLVYDPRLDDTFPGGSGPQRLATPSTWVYSVNPTLCFANFTHLHTDWIIDYASVEMTADFNDEQVGGVNRREVGLTIYRPRTVSSWAKAWRVYMGAFLAWEGVELRVIPARADVDAQGAMTLDGTSSTYADMGDQAVLDMSATQDFTLECSFKTAVTGAMTIVAKKSTQGGLDAGYSIYKNGSNDLVCKIHDGTNVASDTDTTTNFIDDKWHHIAMVIDQTANEMTMYVDGVARTPISITAVTLTLANALAFRVGSDIGANRFTGLIDEVRVWNDERTSGEITANRLVEITDPTADSSLIGYWKFNDLVGVTADDASSQSNDGTLTGNAGFTFGNGQLIPDLVAFHFQVDDIIDQSFRIKKRSRRQFPTIVQIEYTDQTNDTWRRERQQAKAVGVDAGTTPSRFSKVSLPGIHRPAQAHREAIERLNWYLSDLEVTFSVFDEGLLLQQGSIVAVTHPLGLDGKLMRVRRISGFQGRWTIDLAEYDPLIYSDSVIADPSTPDTNLGNPLAPPKVTGLTLDEELFDYKNGITGSRVRATWSNNYPFTSSYLVEGFVDGVQVWQTFVPGKLAVSPGVEELIDDVPVNYDVHVSIVTPFTTGAAEIKTQLIEGKLLKPSNVPSMTIVLTNANTADVTWTAATDIDIWRYDLRIGAVTDSFETATVVDLVDGLKKTVPNLPIEGINRFFIKAVDTVGGQSLVALEKDITTALPLTPTGLAVIEVAGEVRATWNANSPNEFVERYRFSFSDLGETFETTIDTVDGLRLQSKDAPEGTFRFKVYAINAVGESASAATLDVEVTADIGAFLADTFQFVTPGLTNMHQYAFRDSPGTGKKFYVTSPDSGDPFDTSAAPHDFDSEPVALANYHINVSGEFLTEIKDFGLLLTGSWNVTHNLQILSGDVAVTLELSVNGSDFDVFAGTATKGEYRYARVRYTTVTSSTSFITSPPLAVSISVVPAEESGADLTSTTTFKRIELTREYSAIKEVNAQPKNALDAQMAVVDNITVGKNTGIQGDGTGYLDGGDIAAFDFGASQNFTVEFWAKHGASQSGADTLVQKRNGDLAGWEIIHDAATDNVFFTIDDGTNQATASFIDGLPDDGVSHHIAMVVNRSTDQMLIYLDGVAWSGNPLSISAVTGSLANSVAFRIFANQGGAEVWDGTIDELRIWNDVRTTTELTDNDDIEIPITSANLIGYWRMNGVLSASVTTALDQLTAPVVGNVLTKTGGGTLTYVSLIDTVDVKISYFDVYIFDAFGQQLSANFQWNWKGV